MAGIYDMNAAIEKPNLLNAFREGEQYSQAKIDAKTARTTKAEDRAEEAHEKQLKQLRGAAEYMKKALATKDPNAINGAWAAVRPYLKETTGQEPPAAWDPSLAEKMEQALAQTEYLDKDKTGTSGNVQSTQIDNEGNIWTVDRSGNWTNSGIKAAPTGAVINQPGNVPFIATTGRGALGTVSPIGGAPAAAAPVPGAVAPAPVVTEAPGIEMQTLPGASVPPGDEVAMLAAAQNEGQAYAPQANGGALPVGVAPPPIAAPAAATPPVAGPIRNPTAAETAAETDRLTQDSFKTLTPEEVIAEGLPAGSFAQRDLKTNKIVVGPAAVQPDKGGKELTPKELKLKFDAEDALLVAENIDMSLGEVASQLASGKLKLGPLENARSATLNFIGKSDENSQNYATYKASLEKLRNDVLILNKGVQTEGDATRAMNTLIANSNDPEVVKEQIRRILQLNERAAKLQKSRIEELEKRAAPAAAAPAATDDIDALINKYAD